MFDGVPLGNRDGRLDMEGMGWPFERSDVEGISRRGEAKISLVARHPPVCCIVDRLAIDSKPCPYAS